MKNTFFLIVCFVLPNLTHGQFDTIKFNDLVACGDSLFEIRQYRSSAECYSTALRLRNGNAPRIRWATSRSWAAGKYSDSAFYYLDIIANEIRSTLPLYGDILTDTAFRYLHDDRRWVTFKNKMILNYKEIGKKYSERMRSLLWTNCTNNGYEAARAWAASNEGDSAFSYLYKIIDTDYNVFIDYPKLKGDAYFVSLYNDSRWTPILDKLKNNWKWIRTRHSFSGPDIAMVATVDPQSRYLKGDGKGSYKNGVDKVRSLDQHAYNLEISSHRVWYESGNRSELSSRYMILDLNSPVGGTGSIPQGVINDHDIEIHVLFRIDTTQDPQIVYNFREIPIGTTIESDRTEIHFYMSDVLHTLTMGPWGFGRNNEAIAHNGKLTGNGTTKVLVTRHSQSSYTIEAPDGSIGRLWQTQNMTKPIDMGLFRTGFQIHLDRQ